MDRTISSFVFTWIVLSVMFTIVLSEKRSIGPLAHCDGNLTIISDLISECHTRCIMEATPIGSKKISIHQSIAGIQGPTVVECSRVRISQEFTQTWTFSTMKTRPEVSVQDISKEDCESEIRNSCPDMKTCNKREPDELTPEYHFGSTTAQTATYISLINMPSAIMFDESEEYISPLSSSKSFKLNDKNGRDGQKVYLWSDVGQPADCPYERAADYACDNYTDGSYLCAGGRFSINQKKGEKDILPGRCTGLKASKEGFLYKVDEPEGKEAASGRLFISSKGQSLAADALYIKTKVQHLSTHVDAENCRMQCELLSLESKVNRAEPTLTRVGMEYTLIFNGTHGRKCKPTHGCKLATPHILCGNPPRIGLTCTGVGYLWNPVLPYVEQSSPCHKPDVIENLTLHLGHQDYVVDSDMTIDADRKFSHGLVSNEFARVHQSGVHWTISDMQALKDPWIKAQAAGTKDASANVTSKDIRAPHVNIGFKVMSVYRSVANLFSHLESVIGIAFVTAVGVMTSVLTWKVISSIKKQDVKYTQAPSAPQRNNIWA